MSNYKAMQALIAQFSGQHNTIGVPRVLCQLMGSLDGGVFLSQVIYWSDKGRGGWFYKSYKEWEEETMLSEYKVKKYAEELEALGIIEKELHRANGAPTCHYRFDSEKFTAWILKNLGMETENFIESLTETTAETTKDSPPPPPQPTTLEEVFGPKPTPPPAAAGISEHNQPWRDWQGRRVHPLGSVQAQEIRRVGWLLERHGWTPPANGKLTGWLQGVAECYTAAGGDVALIEAAAQVCRQREAQYIPTHPRGVAKEIRRQALAMPRVVFDDASPLEFVDANVFLGGNHA